MELNTTDFDHDFINTEYQVYTEMLSSEDLDTYLEDMYLDWLSKQNGEDSNVLDAITYGVK
jgi:hypothetical protein